MKKEKNATKRSHSTSMHTMKREKNDVMKQSNNNNNVIKREKNLVNNRISSEKHLKKMASKDAQRAKSQERRRKDKELRSTIERSPLCRDVFSPSAQSFEPTWRNHGLGESLKKLDFENIVVTPVNLVNPSTAHMFLARYNYMVESKSFLSSDTCPTWDEDSRGKAKVGHLFGFLQHESNLMEIFKVVRKSGAGHRPDHWIISDHRDRSVLSLSKYIGRVSWSDFLESVGYKSGRPQGTIVYKWSRNLDVLCIP